MVATQMADAKIAYTNVSIVTETSDGEKAEFRSSGREVVFPGFLRAYVEGADDPAAALDDQNNPLPSLREEQSLPATELDPSGHETRPPARYTEATLVKALEAEGIGRPSTYASIIDTIQNRGYVFSNNKQLVPTFTAMAVTRLLEQTHSNVVDLDFTAEMERKLDAIATGKDARDFLASIYEQDVLKGVEQGEDLDPRAVCTLEFEKLAPVDVRVGRYGPYLEQQEEGDEKPRRISLPDELPPADLTPEYVDKLIKRSELGDEPLGEDPETGKPVYVLQGPYGPYVQLGERDDDEKPKRVSIPKDRKMEEIDLEEALDLLALPRTIGKHPEDGKVVKAGIGRYGPYVLHNRVYASLKKDDDVLTVGMERAVELLKAKKKRGRGREPMRELGDHPDGGAVNVFDGRYGPYVKHKRTNATIPDGMDPKSITLDEAVDLVAKKRAKKKGKKKK
jgi:DNA topoisomerase-1